MVLGSGVRHPEERTTQQDLAQEVLHDVRLNVQGNVPEDDGQVGEDPDCALDGFLRGFHVEALVGSEGEVQHLPDVSAEGNNRAPVVQDGLRVILPPAGVLEDAMDRAKGVDGRSHDEIVWVGLEDIGAEV
jgi:hypothetical protein